MSKQAEPHYQAFLLRCWVNPSAAAASELPTWRFELRKVTAAPNVVGFNNVADLTAHISAAMLQLLEEKSK